jgi:hypothetical protein
VSLSRREVAGLFTRDSEQDGVIRIRACVVHNLSAFYVIDDNILV